MPLATVGVGGFDSRPVADAATSGDRRTRLHDDHAHRHGTAPVASRCAQPLVARRLNTGTAPKTSNSETRPRPARKGQGEPVNNLNSILLEGNLARDPELRYTPQGTPICTLNVASTRTYKLDGERVEEVSFIDATTSGEARDRVRRAPVQGTRHPRGRPHQAGALGSRRPGRLSAARQGRDRRRARRVSAGAHAAARARDGCGCQLADPTGEGRATHTTVAR